MKFILFILLLNGLFGQNRSYPEQAHKYIFPVNEFYNVLSFSTITDVVESTNIIYFSTLGGGVLRYDKFKNEFLNPVTTANGLHSNFIYGFLRNRTDSLSKYSQSVVPIYKDAEQHVMDLDEPDQFEPSYSSASFFKGYQLNDRKRLAHKLSESEFYTIQAPFTFFDGNIQDKHQNEHKITLRYIDSSNGVWVFAEGLGLFYSAFKNQPLEHIYNHSTLGSITRIRKNNTDYWFAQHNMKQRNRPILSVWKANGAWKHWYERDEFALQGNGIVDMLISDKSIWLAEEYGLVSFNLDTEDFSSKRFSGSYNNRTTSVIRMDSLLYFGTDVGLFSYSLLSGKVKEQKFKGLEKTPITSLTKGRKGFVTTTKWGVYFVNIKEQRIDNLESFAKLPRYRFSAVNYSNGNYQLGFSDGYYVFNEEQKTLNACILTEPQRPIYVFSIKEVDGYTFLATDNGVYIYYVEKNRWVYFNQKNGLPVNRVNDIEIDGDYLIVGTDAGVSVFKWYDNFYWK